MSLLEEIAEEYKDKPMPGDIFRLWITHLFDLLTMSFTRRLELCTTVEEVKALKKEYLGEDSYARQVEKAVLQAYKNDRIMKKSDSVTKEKGHL